MQTYIVFVKNRTSGEEFVVPHNAPKDAHEQVMAEVSALYPQHAFHIHTAYSMQELEDTLENVRRWPGVASKPQKEAVAPQTRVTTTAIPQAHASIFETKGSMVSQETTPSAPQHQEPLASDLRSQAVEPTPVQATAPIQTIIAAKQALAAQQAQQQAAAPQPMQQTMTTALPTPKAPTPASEAQYAQPQSLISVLKSMRQGQ